MLLSKLLKVAYDGSALLFHQLSYAIEKHKCPPTKKLSYHAGRERTRRPSFECPPEEFVKTTGDVAADANGNDEVPLLKPRRLDLGEGRRLAGSGGTLQEQVVAPFKQVGSRQRHIGSALHASLEDERENCGMLGR